MSESTNPRRPNGGPQFGGGLPVATLRRDPMLGWHEIESMIRRMKPGLLRDQMIDVLKANYADALDEAVAVSDG